jgi:uncharacterized protein (DUF4415 family)
MKNLKKNGKKSTEKIELGTVELDADEFSPAHAKERISIWIDEWVVDAFRERARAQGAKYQTLVNEALRESVKKPSLVARVEVIESKLGIKTG